MEQNRVRLERDGDIAVIVIDNPRMNAGSAAVREGLMAAIATVKSDVSLQGAVLIGAGNTFIAGSDLREFGQPLAEPQLPAVIRAIEDCGKQVVAALHGTALGGGFEQALGCAARVAAPGAVVGLPEVTLGIIPGAGGTQRLLRIVGIPRASAMTCSGERVARGPALAAGLIDAEADGDLRAAAVAHARQLAGRNQRLRDRVVPAADAGAVTEASAAALERGASRIRGHCGSRVKGGKTKAAVAAACEARLSTSLDWPRIAEADLVIEAVFEGMDVKQQVFQRIGALARPGAVLASNTSYLDLDAIAAATARPQDVIGLHFFSPVNVMKLMEIVRGKASAPDAPATGLAVGRKLKKLPVLTGNALGFVGNRLYAAYRRQCEFMVEEGASPEQVDAAPEAFDFAMVPFTVADLSGLDIAWRMRQSQAARRDPAARYVHIADRLCEAGRLGRKTGAGYYRYADAASRPQVDPAVAGLISQACSDKKITPREISAEEIQRRVMLTLVSEAALLLAEGVAERATDVDVVLINGYGFPRWEGGPVFWAHERGAAALPANLDELAALSGPGFVRGDVRHLLETKA